MTINPVLNPPVGLFSMDGSGRGQAAAVNEDGSINGPGNPAPRGSTVALYGTGFGQTSPPQVDGAITPGAAPYPLLTAPIGVIVGGAFASSSYRGAAPLAVAGLSQINVVVPTAISASPSVPVGITMGSSLIVSNTVTIAVK